MSHDIFISYAHQGDNTSREAAIAMVARLHTEMEADFHRRFNRTLEIFFDKEDIQDFDHWKVRCHRALRDSRFFVACLSRSYLRSDACRWEWEEWCKHEVEHGLVGQGAASLWFVRLEDLEAPEDAALLLQWRGDLLQRFHVQCHEWRPGDVGEFLSAAARSELLQLTEHVAQRLRLLTLDRARRGNLPWPNANFVGREPQLTGLRAALLDAPSPIPVGVHGVGGMGKTALAQAFAYNEADAFPGGCWLLRCEGSERLLSVFRTLVNDLQIELTDEQKRDDTLAVQRVFDVLRSRGTALFLLDNVDRPVLLTLEQVELLADQPWARTLYTTRLAADEFTRAGASVRPLELDRLPDDQAVTLIRRYQPGQSFVSQEHEAAAREIVTELSGLTLAVETAAVYLGQCDPRATEPQHAVDMRDYLRTLREDLKTGGNEGVMSQLREVRATLRPTLVRLDAPARTVLQIAALLAPDGLALPWVRAIATQTHPELATESAIGQSDPWTQLVRGLIGMRLFQPTGEPRVVAIHRILQRVLHTELAEGRELLEARLEEHVRTRASALERETHWQESRWELQPVGALAELWADIKHIHASWLLGQAGVRWQALAEWIKAELLLRKALEIDEERNGCEHSSVGYRLNNLAECLREAGRFEDAEPLYIRALGIGEKTLGLQHPDMARTISNLGLLMQALGRMKVAEAMFHAAIDIGEKSLGSQHPDIAVWLNNLALLFLATNRLTEAEPLFLRAIEIDEMCLPPAHPDKAVRLNNFVTLLLESKRHVEAELYCRKALAITEEAFGPNHPKVGIRLNNLGSILTFKKCFSEAELVLKRAILIGETSPGLKHPEHATCFNNLAYLLMIAERFLEAEPFQRRALEIDENVLGSDHPTVARDHNNLSQILVATGRLQEAEPFAKTALSGFAKFTAESGHEHPHMRSAIRDYAMLLEVLGLSEVEIRQCVKQILSTHGLSLGD